MARAGDILRDPGLAKLGLQQASAYGIHTYLDMHGDEIAAITGFSDA
jgi:hypothetical protein